MSKSLKPMLAYQRNPDLNSIKYPVIASPKLDGIRCLIVNGAAVSRSLKPIRNKFVQSILGRHDLNGLDGELIVGNETDQDVYLRTNSGVMSIEGEPDFVFKVFDCWPMTTGYPGRSCKAQEIISCSDDHWAEKYVRLHEGKVCHSVEEVLAYEKECLDMGYEGLILRDSEAPYKFGRSTLNEFALVKLKRFEDDEAEIVDIVEAVFNDNEAATNELGRTQRSQSKEGRTRGKGMAGLVVARSPKWGDTFELGSFKGFTNSDKTKLLEQKHDYIGKQLVKFKHFSHGSKDKPRHGVVLGFRDKADL